MTLTESETQGFLNRCVSCAYLKETGDFRNKTVLGDSFEAAAALPDECADLLIADPPYNMTKTFGKQEFARMSEEDYRAFTEKWVRAYRHTLKKPLPFTCAAIGKAVLSSPPFLKSILP